MAPGEIMSVPLSENDELYCMKYSTFLWNIHGTVHTEMSVRLVWFT